MIGVGLGHLGVNQTLETTKLLGVFTVALILFLGGMETDINHIRPILLGGVLLSTIGVLVTALIVGFFLHFGAIGNFQMGLTQALLVGSIVASTDAAAVFSILRSQRLHLKANLGPFLELESGSNDVMVYFLMTFLLSRIAHPATSLWSALPNFCLEMVVGSLGGLGAGNVMLWVLNNINLRQKGLYPALILGLLFLTYGGVNALHGSGYLAVYLAGMQLGHHDFVHKKAFLRFGKGLEWLMQIIMFISLGLLVIPGQLIAVIPLGLQLSLILIFIARPVSVFCTLALTSFNLRHKAFISWVGLRGAVPVVFATYLYELPNKDEGVRLFHLIFFVVLFSIFFQGTSLTYLAKVLGLEARGVVNKKQRHILELYDEVKKMLVQVDVPADSEIAGQQVVSLKLPKGVLIILICRLKRYFTVDGTTVIEARDKLFLIVDSKKEFQQVRRALGHLT